MKSIRGLLIVLLWLLVSACSQEAEQPFEPTSGNAVVVQTEFPEDIWATISQYWTDETPRLFDREYQIFVIERGDSTYIRYWKQWVCPDFAGARYRVERFVSSAESADAEILFTQMSPGKWRSNEQRPEGCIDVYVLHEDYGSFFEAVQDL